MKCMGARRSTKFSQIRPPTAELAGLERLKNPHGLIMGKNVVATFSRLFLIGSISSLQVAMAYMRAWMNLKFGQIRILVSIATEKVIMKKRCCHFFSAVFYRILFILAGNDYIH